jgi:putative transposase
MDDYDNLCHSVWECKYHVVFIPKYRKKVLYGEIRRRMDRWLTGPLVSGP